MNQKISIFTIVILSLSLILTGCNSSKYTDAMTLYANGEWDQAVEIFMDLGNYKDSQSMIQKSYYSKAKELAENGDYDTAIDIFTSLGNYENSQDMVNECLYSKAMQLVANKEFEVAIDTFQKLGGYKDSAQQILDTQVLQIDEQLQGIWKGSDQIAGILLDYTFHFSDKRCKGTVSVQGTSMSNSGTYRIALDEQAIYVLYDQGYIISSDGTSTTAGSEQKPLTYKFENGKLLLFYQEIQLTFAG